MCGTGNRKSTGFSAPSDALRGIGCRTGTNAKEAGSVMLSASDYYMSGCDGSCVTNALNMAHSRTVCPFIIRSSYG